MRLNRVVAAFLLALAASASLPALAADDGFAAAIASPIRTDADRKDDAKRKPAQFLEFAKVKPGMKVLDVVAGGGATAQLLALAVGPKGEVYAQNSKPNANLDKRLAAQPQANLKPVVRGFDNPAPAGVTGFDLITINMNYHDIVNAPVDRAAMNKALFEALKPGGYLVIIDNAAKEGQGLSVTNTLHRIEDASVIAEVSKAGFVLDGRGDYLRVPSDPKDQPFFKMDGPDDKFALRFVKK
ncbi:class I SAM-dependent methyltransferase [Massilia sp. TS11]|uniref:class I SAM-dependent methyltransferase n=1 Tax=Massilia sp. TS11 TaxID=2908003 RepID=UPI001EDA8735|nr:class I SAM-dependent methyltransferase [Massilia sp. TS11]MCG2585721.1 class I SAM-dependent methyltransferase [Massilia sp. TS11]